MGYQLREEPLTLDEIKFKSADNYIEEVIPVDLDDIIAGDLEAFCHLLVLQLIDCRGDIEDLEWEVVGNGLYDMVHIKVSGYVILVGDQ